MRLTALRLSGLVLIAVLASAAAEAGKSPFYVHVRTKENGKHGVDLAFPWTPKLSSPLHFTQGTIDVDDAHLRDVWRTLRAQPEGYVVTLHDHGEAMRVTREGGYCTFRVSPRHHDKRVIVRVPEYVMETLVGDTATLLSEKDIARVVRERGRVDLVLVDSGDEHVRVWIDQQDEWD